MGFMTESLGVKCSFCHNTENYSSDENAHKVEARMMLEMVQYLNRDIFKENRISCFTCHAGQEEPVQFPEDFTALPSLTSEGKPRQLSADFKNVQRLQHLTGDEYDEVMSFFTASLGVRRCTYCHDRSDYSLDADPHKMAAREMITMVQGLNKKFFETEKINCFTCHKAQEKPLVVPPKWKTE